MPYVRVPRDLTNFKEKFMFGLTLRQIVSFGSALVVGLPVFFVLRHYHEDLALYAAMILAAPFAAFGIVNKNGLPLEKFIGSYIRCRILAPRKRRYQTQNFYQTLSDPILMQIDEDDKPAERKNHGKRKSKP